MPRIGRQLGPEFEALYTKYEAEGKGRKTMKAQDLWFKILESQVETGTPYMLYKDAANGKSNQQNLGTIRSSNLCTEIIEYTSPDEVAVCNLASIAVPKFVKEDRTFDHDKLFEVTYRVTRNLNRVIDRNYYPIPEARNSNMRHRPIGLGVRVGRRLHFDALPLRQRRSPSAQQGRLRDHLLRRVHRVQGHGQGRGAYETFPVLQPAKASSSLTCGT